MKREHCQQDKHCITLPLWQHHTPSIVIIKVITMGQKLAVMVIESMLLLASAPLLHSMGVNDYYR